MNYVFASWAYAARAFAQRVFYGEGEMPLHLPHTPAPDFYSRGEARFAARAQESFLARPEARAV